VSARVARAGRAVLGVAVTAGGWEAACRAGLVPAAYLPPPTVVVGQVARLLATPSFRADAVSTGLSWAIAVGGATMIGVALGLLMGAVPVLRALLAPVVEVLRPLPSVALIPLAVVVLGSGSQIKITVAMFAATWPVLINTVHAVHAIDPLQVDTARIYRVPRHRVLLRLTLPAIAPAVATGIRLSASIAVIVVVGTEFLAGGTIGLGQFAYLQGATVGRMDLVLATVLLVAVANYAVDTALLGLQRRTMPWAEPQEAR